MMQYYGTAYSPPTINIKRYVRLFLLLPSSFGHLNKSGTHPRSCLCQGAVIILIPPMDQTSDLRSGPKDKPSSFECSRWWLLRQILWKIEAILYIIWTREKRKQVQIKLDC